jgi:guanyl-specific ribonuclease Sa
MSGAYNTYGENGVFVGNPEGRRPLRRPSLRREDTIKMNLEEVE